MDSVLEELKSNLNELQTQLNGIYIYIITDHALHMCSSCAHSLYITEMAGRVIGSFYVEIGEGQKAFNAFSLAGVSTFTVETIGWLSVIVQNWIMTLPSKKRKGVIPKLVHISIS